MARRARSPDGLEWTIRVHRVRMPGWHHSSYDPWNEDLWFFGVVFAVIQWLVLPLAWLLVQLPVAFARAVVSSTRWVNATSSWPTQMKVIWKVRREHACAVADHVTSRLAEGYEDLEHPEAELVYVSPPPGVRDLDR